MKKKILSIILSVVTVVSALSVGSMTAFAGGWADTAKSVKLNTTYTESAETTDVKLGNYYYDAVKFTVPAKGKINIKITSENESYTIRQFATWDDICSFRIYKAPDLENYIWYSPENLVNNGYSSAGNYYYGDYTANLSKGTYYLVFSYLYGCVGTNKLAGSFDYRISYTPSFSRTSIRKTSTPKKGQIRVDWDKCANVSGYQVQYSRNKNMKNAKRITAKGSNNYSRTIKNLSSKKKYYVRVRTYKTVKVNGKNKTYYSKWSSKKSVTTR